MFNLSCFSCVGESVRCFSMGNHRQVTQPCLELQRHVPSDGLGCVVVVCEFRTNE